MPARTTKARSSMQRSSRKTTAAKRSSHENPRPMTRQEAGRLGAEARWGRRYENEPFRTTQKRPGTTLSRMGATSRTSTTRTNQEARRRAPEPRFRGSSKAGRQGVETRRNQEFYGQNQSRKYGMNQTNRPEAMRRGTTTLWERDFEMEQTPYRRQMQRNLEPRRSRTPSAWEYDVRFQEPEYSENRDMNQERYDRHEPRHRGEATRWGRDFEEDYEESYTNPRGAYRPETRRNKTASRGRDYDDFE